ncbi:MAG: TonB-dependent receptor [Bacteroidetes bacterium]|nr:MAG: TonB-dependent receptor [Bacteroidota bacterium]
MKKQIIILLALIGFNLSGISQNTKTDANIIGHVKCRDHHLPFVSIILKGTNTGTTTDETGHYQLVNLTAGEHVLRAQMIGYAPQEKEVTLEAGQTLEVNFMLQEDALGLQEVVVTGDRSERNRTESVVSVNTITPKLFSVSQSVTANDGINFCPGIRTEDNCQNCGLNQVRINGMAGPYSQILIDGRPVFSGLASVYGLELIPASMIKRIEVVKGGGSVLYGSNAIAGTINLILDDPVKNAYDFGMSAGSVGLGLKDTGPPAVDYNITLNGSMISNDHQSGMSLFGFFRNRQPFDANDDGFSEIPKLRNLTTGTRLFHRFGTRSKLTGDLFIIHEKRRGGNDFTLPPHEADICEGTTNTLLNWALSSETFLREQDQLSVYVSGQNVHCDSYYGANKSLKGYGTTTNFTWVAGAQYLARFKHSSLTTGIEDQGSALNDQDLGYPDYEHAVIVEDSIVDVPHTGSTLVADQSINTIGIFAQYEQKWNILTASAGLRYDRYEITDHAGEGGLKARGVWIPRVSLLVNILKNLQGRISYSQGYRTPQLYDEDLHVETSGSRRVIHENAPGLKQETSHSVMASFNVQKNWDGKGIDITLEGFYTLLTDPFIMDYGIPDSTGTVIYTRRNSDQGAYVYGMNLQVDAVPVHTITLTSGFTWQQSRYDTLQEFETKCFFRTPDIYGFLTFDWEPLRHASVASTLNYTGPMLVPYFGPNQADPDAGELRTSGNFFDWSIKMSYTIPLNGASLQIYVGMKNILNSYQKDFDRGIDRDPGYIYGPGTPRTLYAGLSFGNLMR